ncbi:hypothetical protein ACIRBX_32720 [Kitasatospora sp. NPDC096147]|uniref:hypothetical protein n=1 Tax=Kitasatospora sp. NPDC096147 TaxID=3364093 RepID=UPI00381E7D50
MRRLPTGRQLLWTVALLALLAGAASWWQAERATAGVRARDAATAAGRTAAEVLGSADGRDPEGTRARWRAVADGPLRSRLEVAATDPAEDVATGTTTSATVAEAALTRLDREAGTAGLIAVLRLRQTLADGTVTTDRRRVAVELVRRDGGWKASGLTTVPVGAP